MDSKKLKEQQGGLSDHQQSDTVQPLQSTGLPTSANPFDREARRKRSMAEAEEFTRKEQMQRDLQRLESDPQGKDPGSLAVARQQNGINTGSGEIGQPFPKSDMKGIVAEPFEADELDSLPPEQQQEVMDQVLRHLIRKELKRRASRQSKRQEQAASAKPQSPMLNFKSGPEIEAYRKSHGLSQKEFWSKVGTTQSGGSRYESETDGRDIPRPVQMLLELAYGTEKQAAELMEWMRAK